MSLFSEAEPEISGPEIPNGGAGKLRGNKSNPRAAVSGHVRKIPKSRYDGLAWLRDVRSCAKFLAGARLI
jgi:hypothetical protein